MNLIMTSWISLILLKIPTSFDFKRNKLFYWSFSYAFKLFWISYRFHWKSIQISNWLKNNLSWKLIIQLSKTNYEKSGKNNFRVRTSLRTICEKAVLAVEAPRSISFHQFSLCHQPACSTTTTQQHPNGMAWQKVLP